MNPNLQKAIDHLKRTTELHPIPGRIELENGRIWIQPTKDSWGAIFYFAFLIVAPVLYLAFLLYHDKAEEHGFWILIFIGLSAYYFIKMVSSDRALIVTFSSEIQLETRNTTPILGYLLPTTRLPIEQIARVKLEDKSIGLRGRKVVWKELWVVDYQNKAFVLTCFEEDSNSARVAQSVKQLIEQMMMVHQKKKR